MNINALAGAYVPTYLSESTKRRSDYNHWDALMEHQRLEAVGNRNRLGLDQLEANSNAARARVHNVEPEIDISSLSIEERLALIAEEGKNVDRSNMSDREILEEVYGRFDKYLDHDIFPPFHDNPLSDQNSVSSALRKELTELNLIDERLMNARIEMFGYDGMTNAEMKKAITTKYVSQEMTTANFLRMMTEMEQTGAMDWRSVNDVCRTVANSVEMTVMRGIVKEKGYTFWEILSDYQNIAGEAIYAAYHAKTSISDLYAGAEYMMTKGGWVNLQVENNVNNIFKELIELGLR